MTITIRTKRPAWRAPACVLNATGNDADTRRVLIATSEDSMRIAGLRIMGVDTPESKTQHSNAPTTEGKNYEAAVGQLVSLCVDDWIASRSGHPLLTVTHANGVIVFDFELEYVGGDKFSGRVLGDLYAPDVASGEDSLREFLLRNGLAREYDGGPKLPWTAEQLERITEYAKAYLGHRVTPSDESSRRA